MIDYLKPFKIIAAIGFLLSLIVHILSLFSINHPLEEFSMILHIGIFITFGPAVFSITSLVKIDPKNSKDSWKVILKYCPKWMYNTFYAMFIYTGINFIYFMFFLEKTNSDSTVRGFSGHWLLFYFASYAILYSNIIRTKNILPKQIDCRNCNAPLNLEIKERVEKKYTCQACSKLIDLSQSEILN
jgi:hypothetical protein